MSETVKWIVEIDWAADDNYIDEGDRLLSYASRRGKERTVTGDSLAMTSPGEISLTLDNHDGRYDPYNVLSPLSGYIKPARVIRVLVSYGGVSNYIFSGRIDDIRLSNDKTEAIITAYDDLVLLQNITMPLIAMQENQTVADLIAMLLDEADWHGIGGTAWVFSTQLGVDSYLGGVGIQDNGDEVPFYWGSPGKTLFEGIYELAHAFGGDVYAAADGAFMYVTRDLVSDPSYTIDQGMALKDIMVQQPWDEVRNKITIRSASRKVASQANLFLDEDVKIIGPGDTQTFFAEYSVDPYGSGPALDISNPAIDPRTGPSNSYPSMAAYADFSYSVYATGAILKIKNTHATNDLYIIGMSVVGYLVPVASNIEVVETDQTSINDYTKRELLIETNWLQTQTEAALRGVLAALIHIYGTRVTWLRIANRFDLQYSLDLFSTVKLNIPSLGIEGDHRITYIEHQYNAGGLSYTTYRLEPATRGEGFWKFPAKIEQTTILGW